MVCRNNAINENFVTIAFMEMICAYYEIGADSEQFFLHYSVLRASTGLSLDARHAG
jgi:hypothetical protein